MIKIYTTAEVSQKTGLTDRSVRRRLDTDFAPRVTIQNGQRTVYGVTEQALRNYRVNTAARNARG